MSSCYHCNQVFPVDLKAFRSTECPGCKRDVRVCRNCRHYAPGMHWDCRESVTDQVNDKERANFCDWFKLAETIAAKAGKPNEQAGQARKGFAALFGEDGDN